MLGLQSKSNHCKAPTLHTIYQHQLEGAPTPDLPAVIGSRYQSLNLPAPTGRRHQSSNLPAPTGRRHQSPNLPAPTGRS